MNKKERDSQEEGWMKIHQVLAGSGDETLKNKKKDDMKKWIRF